MDFKETFITNNFELLENQPDVSLKSMDSGFVPSASIYSGSSILSSHASGQMTDTFKDYIKKNVLNECLINVDEGKGYFEAKDITSSDDYLEVGMLNPEDLTAKTILQFISTKIGKPYRIYLIS